MQRKDLFPLRFALKTGPPDFKCLDWKDPNGLWNERFPRGHVLRGFYILQNHTAYVDLSREIRDHHPGGAKSELMTIYSMVNSLILNIPEIETVKILVEGKEETTLAGHVDLRFPLQANMLFVR